MNNYRNILDTEIEFLKGVGPSRAEVLKKELNIFRFRDLLFFFPYKYIDKSKILQINQIQYESSYVQIKGVVTKIVKLGKPRQQRLVAIFSDHTGSIELVWFRGIRWVEKMIRLNTEYVVFGKPTMFKGKFNITHPDLDLYADENLKTEAGLQAQYSSSEKLKSRGLNSKGIRNIILNLLNQLKGSIHENLPLNIVNKYHFLSRDHAFLQIHFPENSRLLEKAQQRLKYEEFFFLQFRLLKQMLLHTQKIKGHLFKSVGTYFNKFYSENLPFKLTDAQKKVIREIRRDLGSGKQMNRLLQGDVGSGKTIVSLMSMLIAIDNGFQATLMAPTEILANQHFNSISNLVNGLPLKVAILTGNIKGSKRKEILDNLITGGIHILIGTHALIEDPVKFKNLGLTVIDEQHRFGVAQRARLWKKNTLPPHILVMTATPIPRTLAMTVYGDLDVSIIDELPPGRKPIKTIHQYDKNRLKVFGFIKEKIAEGRQIYIVYPLIKESEKLDLKDLMDGYESISRAFPLPEYAISIVHGQMKSQDKDFEMQRFVKGETHILISTTVIEVGVDVSNATVMIIENANRFGLSQLHQLRGRVGRGAEQSYCILMTDYKVSVDGKKRIQTMVNTTDGFEIAEADLRLRGPGDIMGTRQSGILDLKIANIIKDDKVLQKARKDAITLIQEDPSLQLPQNNTIRLFIKNTESRGFGWEKIS